jgi:DNA repair protein RecO (recombination protein O)
VHLATTAIVCSVRQHGEHGAIARLLTAEAGLLAGYVRGGNIVAADFRARTEDQLAALTVELAHSRAPLLAEPLAAAAIDWVTTLTAAALPEGQGYPSVHGALDGLLHAVELAPSASGWAPALVRYETLLLSALGYGGLDPTHDFAAALRRNGLAIDEHLLTGPRAAGISAVRERLVERLTRAFG